MLHHTVIILAVAICSANAAFVVTPFDNALAESLSAPASCNPRTCNLQCRRVGFHSGTCYRGRCYCDGYLQNRASDDSLSSEASCDYRACDQLCRRLGFPGGACVGDRCQCDNFLQPQEDNAIPSSDVVSSVNHDMVNVLRENKPESNDITADVEVNGDQDVLSVTETSVPELHLRSSVSRASCDCVTRDCNFYCFRIRYTGGICVTGQCRCYK